MKTKQLQQLMSEIVKKIDQKYGIDRDVQLNISQLVEELGELAKEANLKKLRNKEPQKEDLEDEFADVFLQLATLATGLGVDLEEAALKKVEVLKERHDL
ncbi:nucleotide pyrophosphohydrolase [Patescibacteria group bacterium]|nr:nucleotide pyrophosphohydrolase [Patescibacteria group bacterium]